jgi:hypothetical protein
MGELSESVPEEQPPGIGLISHRRLLIEMAIVVIAGSMIMLALLSWNYAAGFIVGGLLSFANYLWLKGSLRKLFDRADEGTSTALLALVYIFRYFLLGLAVYLIYLTGAFPVVAVVLGLGSFAIAVLIEGFYNIFSTFNKREI